MGKVRIKSFGDEEAEQKQAEKARKKAEAKRIAEELAKKEKVLAGEETSAVEEKVRPEPKTEETPEVKMEEPQESSEPKTEADTEEKTVKKQKEKFANAKQKIRSESYKNVVGNIDKTKTYNLKEALELLPKLKRAKFDETVELHINTTEQGIGATITLPHGTGKTVRVAIADASDSEALTLLLKEIESGKLSFDVLLATPETMPQLAKVARVLGPRGLMPNPKNGTVTKDPKKAAEEFAKGQITFKTEAKSPIIHLAVGKVSFGDEKLTENIKAVVRVLPKEKIRSATLKSTMSPGIRVSLTS